MPILSPYLHLSLNYFLFFFFLFIHFLSLLSSPR